MDAERTKREVIVAHRAGWAGGRGAQVNAGFLGAKGNHYRQPGRLMSREIAKEIKRLLVRPVSILDDQH